MEKEEGEEGREKEAEDLSREKEEKFQSSAAAEREASANNKGEGSEGKVDSEEDKAKGETEDDLTFVSDIFNHLGWLYCSWAIKMSLHFWSIKSNKWGIYKKNSIVVDNYYANGEPLLVFDPRNVW